MISVVVNKHYCIFDDINFRLSFMKKNLWIKEFKLGIIRECFCIPLIKIIKNSCHYQRICIIIVGTMEVAMYWFIAKIYYNGKHADLSDAFFYFERLANTRTLAIVNLACCDEAITQHKQQLYDVPRTWTFQVRRQSADMSIYEPLILLSCYAPLTLYISYYLILLY